MLSGLGTVVPPTAVPQALEQRCRMAIEKVDVGPQGFFIVRPSKNLASETLTTLWHGSVLVLHPPQAGTRRTKPDGL